MRIAEVIGTVTLSRPHPALAGFRFIVGVPQDRGALLDGKPSELEDIVIYDDLGAGVGSRIGLSENLSGESLALGVEALARDDAQDETVAAGGLRVDRVASEDHAHRNARRHVARQGLRASGRRNVAEAHFREAEAGVV